MMKIPVLGLVENMSFVKCPDCGKEIKIFGESHIDEIADEFGISRQGARDNIKRGEKQLSEYEEKLGLAKRFLDISAEIKEMNGIVDTLEGNEDKVNNLKRIFARISLEI